MNRNNRRFKAITTRRQGGKSKKNVQRERTFVISTEFLCSGTVYLQNTGNKRALWLHVVRS
jgi:hypothetical protein